MEAVELLTQAAAHAMARADQRTFLLGAIGVRFDGARVMARNGTSTQRTPEAHAEARLARKLDRGSVVYVARVRCDGTWALARPCPRCMLRLRSRGVVRVFYTLGPGSFVSECL